MSARSALYVPGDRPEKLAKALERGADALVVDLEDAVPAGRKAAALDAVAAWLASQNPGDTELWVRVNGGASLAAEVRALAELKALRGLYLPKTTSPDEVAELDALLGDSPLAVVVLVETAAGVLRAPEIAAAPRVVRLAIGEADLTAELGVDPSADGRELAPMRAQVILASAAAGIDPPIGPVSTDFRDLDALRESTDALRRMGFAGRAAIHPAQVPVINDVFTPTDEEVAAARDIVAGFEAAGGAAFAGPNGRMVDEPVVKAARRVIDRARRRHFPTVRRENP